MRLFKFKTQLIHITLWIIFVFLPLLILPQPNYWFNIDSGFIIGYTISSLLVIAFFYLNYFFFVPKLYLKKKYLLFVLIVISYFLLLFIFSKLISIITVNVDTYRGQGKNPINIGLVFRFIVVLFTSIGLRVSKKWEKIEIEKTKAELANLKAQINPHFLFNTLNGIYSHALVKSDNTADYISKLSSIMRYAFKENENEKVTLEDEINFISDYIELQRIRLTEKAKINFNVEGNYLQKRIEPLLLIVFIENAFKYGVSTEKKSTISIDLNISDNELLVTIKNDKLREKLEITESNETGINNAKKRLNLIYGDDFNIQISESKKEYIVNLRIPL